MWEPFSVYRLAEKRRSKNEAYVPGLERLPAVPGVLAGVHPVHPELATKHRIFVGQSGVV
jgi:hypothetical protein